MLRHFSEEKETLVINVGSHFTWEHSEPFFRAYHNLETKPKHYVVELQDVEDLDGSALGSLLALHAHANGQHATVTLAHCAPACRRIMELARMDDLFSYT